jgi:hypothetical protein
MRQLDLKQLAAKVSVEHGIRVDPDDPIMAVVTLNRLVLEQAANEIADEVRSKKLPVMLYPSPPTIRMDRTTSGSTLSYALFCSLKR